MTSSFRLGFLYDVGLSQALDSNAGPACRAPHSSSRSRGAQTCSRPPRHGVPASSRPLSLARSPSPFSLPRSAPTSRQHVRDPALRRREGGPLRDRLGSQRALLQLPPPGHQLLGQPVQEAPQAGADWQGQESGDRRR